ncbi:MAG: dihydrofolate reductase [Planctomycetaceae bacterium]
MPERPFQEPQPGLSIIYARSQNNCIGNDGGLPWSLPDEYAHFEQTTAGYPILMGRRSYEDHDGAIDGRLNIVLSRNRKLKVPADILLAENLPIGIQLAIEKNLSYFVIGGSELIMEALPKAKTVFETVVHTDIDGDTFLPALDFSDWSSKVLSHHLVDSRHGYAYTIYRHRRP